MSAGVTDIFQFFFGAVQRWRMKAIGDRSDIFDPGGDPHRVIDNDFTRGLFTQVGKLLKHLVSSFQEQGGITFISFIIKALADLEDSAEELILFFEHMHITGSDNGFMILGTELV